MLFSRAYWDLVSEIIRTAIFAKIPTLQAFMSFDDSSLHGVGINKKGTMGAIYAAYKAARTAPVRALSFK
jgi:hypothetical protein